MDMIVPYLHSERILVSDEFIERNKLSLKDITESQKRLQLLEMVGGLFDSRSEVHSYYEHDQEAYTLHKVVQDFLDYMNFAWDKIECKRGLSAMRSIDKLGEWLWLLSREDLHNLIRQSELYHPYGLPAVKRVCEELGIDMPELDMCKDDDY